MEPHFQNKESPLLVSQIFVFTIERVFMTELFSIEQHRKNILFEIYKEDGEKFIHFSGYFDKTFWYPELEEDIKQKVKKDLWTPHDFKNSTFPLTEFLSRNRTQKKTTQLRELCPELLDAPSLPISRNKAEGTLDYLMTNRLFLEFYEISELTPCGEYVSTQNELKRYKKESFLLEDSHTKEQQTVWMLRDLRTSYLFKENGRAVVFQKENSAQLAANNLNHRDLRPKEVQETRQTISR